MSHDIDETARMIAAEVFASIPLRLRQQINPQAIKTDMQKAAAAELIAFPPTVSGTRCGNCRHVTQRGGKDFCQHPRMGIPLTYGKDHMCCDYWSNGQEKKIGIGGGAQIKQLGETPDGIVDENGREVVLDRRVDELAPAPGRTGGYDEQSRLGNDIQDDNHDPAPIDDQLADHPGSSKADQLLQTAQEEGAKRLERLTASAIARHGDLRKVLRLKSLFDETERDALASSFAHTNVTGDLLGRSRIRKEQEHHNHVERYGETEEETVNKMIAEMDEWITVGGGRGKDGKGGGHPVLLDNAGKVKGGAIPKALQGKKIADAGKALEKKGKEEKKENKDEEPKGPEKPNGKVTDEGVVETDKPEDPEKIKRAEAHEKKKEADEKERQELENKIKVKINPDALQLLRWVAGQDLGHDAQSGILSRLEKKYGLDREDGDSVIEELKKQQKKTGGGAGKKDVDATREKLKKQAKEGNPLEHSEQFFECFADKPIHPMAPAKAVDFFSKLTPTLGKYRNDSEWKEGFYKKGFSLAVDTDKEILGKLKEAIRERLASGATTKGPQALQAIMDDAGIATTIGGKPADASYSRMCFRTSAMAAYNAGAFQEMSDPDVKDSFPVWNYINPDDGRSGEDHKPHFGKYFANSTTFEEVRDRFIVKHGEVVRAGKGEARIYNCRCSFLAVSKREWARLQASGARLST